MSPKPNDAPTCRLQSPVCSSVALYIARNFLPPIMTVIGGHAAVLRAAVPKTTIYKNGQTFGSEDKIRAAGKGLMSTPALYAGSPQNGDKR